MGDENRAASPAAVVDKPFSLTEYRQSQEGGSGEDGTATKDASGTPSGDAAGKETPGGGQQATQGDSDTGTPAGKDDGDGDYHPKTRKRIDELLEGRATERGLRQAAEREAAELRKRLEAMETGRRPAGDADAGKTLTRPDPKKYRLDTADGTSKYTEDLEAYLLEQADQRADKRVEAALKKYGEDAGRKATERSISEGWVAQVTEARKTFKDFDEVAFSEFPVSDALAGELKAMPNGAEVLYFLGKNPELAAGLSVLKGKELDRAIGRVEGIVNASKAGDGDGSGGDQPSGEAGGDDVGRGKRREPPNPIGGGGTRTDGKLHVDLPMEEYRRRAESGAGY